MNLESRDRRAERQIFLCDASAEAGRLLTVLQNKGYSVVDVPLGLLLNRCRHELPEVVICDADAHEAPARLADLATLERGTFKLLLIGHDDGTLKRDPTLKALADSSFVRPIDVDQIVDYLTKICSPPRRISLRPRLGRLGLMPSLVAAARKPYRSDGRFFEGSGPAFEKEEPTDGGWSTDAAPSWGPLITDSSLTTNSSAPGALPSSLPSIIPTSRRLALSAETMTVLEMGRRRVETYPKQAARPVRLSVGSHLAGCDLRPELLAALELPLSDTGYGGLPDEVLSESTSPGSRNSESRRADLRSDASAPPASLPTGVNSRNRADSSPPEIDEETNPGGRPGATQPPPELEVPELPAEKEPLLPLEDLSDLLSSPWSGIPPQSNSDSELDLPSNDLSSTQPPRRLSRGAEVVLVPVSGEPDLADSDFYVAPSAPPSLFAYGKGKAASDERRQVAPRSQATQTGNFALPPAPPQNQAAEAAAMSTVLAQAIRERISGAVAQQDKHGVRRVVLADGDIATAISAVSAESLAQFLHVRGDITAETLMTLGSIPAFGRHAGAALIARGLLQQEDLWPVLRAHAEWILGLSLHSVAKAVIELNVPQRLLDEPAVFGGAAGTEIYLEVLQRVVTPNQALVALGGGERILGQGPHEALMGESALSLRDQQAIWENMGKPLSPLMNRESRLLPLLLGLTQLGVLTVGAGEIAVLPVEVQTRNREIDDEAFVSKLTARRSLVEEGDYFALLGIPRSATGYDVDRARDELLTLYSEQRLSSRTVHLRGDLEIVRSTIEEAHLVLRDDVRRYRYRNALEAKPS